MPHYNLSKEQEEFVKEAEEQGCKVDLNYSNEFLKGRKCPAVFTDTKEAFKALSFNGKGVQWDKIEAGFVIYAPF